MTVRLLLFELEAATGLRDLSEGERNVLAALVLLGGYNRPVKPGDLRQHALASGLTHPTYHRVLRGLQERGFVDYEASEEAGRGSRVMTAAILPGTPAMREPTPSPTQL